MPSIRRRRPQRSRPRAVSDPTGRDQSGAGRAAPAGDPGNATGEVAPGIELGRDVGDGDDPPGRAGLRKSHWSALAPGEQEPAAVGRVDDFVEAAEAGEEPARRLAGHEAEKLAAAAARGREHGRHRAARRRQGRRSKQRRPAPGGSRGAPPSGPSAASSRGSDDEQPGTVARPFQAPGPRRARGAVEELLRRSSTARRADRAAGVDEARVPGRRPGAPGRGRPARRRPPRSAIAAAVAGDHPQLARR